LRFLWSYRDATIANNNANIVIPYVTLNQKNDPERHAVSETAMKAIIPMTILVVNFVIYKPIYKKINKCPFLGSKIPRLQATTSNTFG